MTSDTCSTTNSRGRLLPYAAEGNHERLDDWPPLGLLFFDQSYSHLLVWPFSLPLPAS